MSLIKDITTLAADIAVNTATGITAAVAPYATATTDPPQTATGIAADLIRGHTDAIILANLSGADSYGYRINKEITKLTNGGYELKEATLYIAFKRLEERGLVHSYWGGEDAGPRRKYYSVTDNGRDALQQMRFDWQFAKTTIDTLIYQNSNALTETSSITTTDGGNDNA
jgi:DNA-binding PadR family transcriptional regulator